MPECSSYHQTDSIKALTGQKSLYIVWKSDGVKQSFLVAVKWIELALKFLLLLMDSLVMKESYVGYSFLDIVDNLLE